MMTFSPLIADPERNDLFSVEIGTSDKPIPALSDDPHWSYDAEIETLQRWLRRVYPHLDLFSKRLPYEISYQWISENVTWVVDCGPPTPRGGASAEDDPNFYVFPNQQLYHKVKNPTGRIRITVTRQKLRHLQLIEAIETEFGTDELGALHREAGFFAHELTHAAQFMRRPLRNFFNHLEMVEKGVVALALMNDIEEKATKYEPEGFFIAALHEAGWETEIASFNERVALYRQRQPAEFAISGKFASLSKYRMGLTKEIVEFVESQGSVRVQRWIHPGLYWLMRGLYEPPQIVRRMVQLAQQACQTGYDSKIESELISLQENWNALFGSEESIAYLRIRHPYLFTHGIVTKYEELLKFWSEIQLGNRSQCLSWVAIDMLK